jgi:hypothetical protein
MIQKILTLLFLSLFITPTFGSEQITQVLTSAERGVHLDSWQISHEDVAFESESPWSIRKYTLHGGKQEGVDVIEVDNGKLSFTVVPTRGMGILKAKLGDVRLGWDSPVKEVVHPQYVNLQERGGLGWLDGFNEWMVRCGIEFMGHPGKDKFINNAGDEAEMDLTLHGKIANIPASEVEVSIDREPPHRIRIRGIVHERMFYGPKFELWTEYSTIPGSHSLRMDDKITNRGGFDQEFEILYHVNFGPPLLEEGAQFVGAVKEVFPFNAHAAKHINKYNVYEAPVLGFIEQVYCMHPYADDNKMTQIMIQNKAASRALSMTFSIDQLPIVNLWKNTSSLEEGYVTGLEPGTSFPYNRRIERKFGRIPVLNGGKSRDFSIEYTALITEKEVAMANKQIKAIQKGRKTRVKTEPPEID